MIEVLAPFFLSILAISSPVMLAPKIRALDFGSDVAGVNKSGAIVGDLDRAKRHAL